MQLKLLRKKYSTKKYYKKQFFLTLNTLYRKHIEMVPQGNSYFIRTLLQFYQGKTRCMQNQVSMNYESQSMTGFHGLPDPEADRSKLVWDFKKILVLVRPGPRYSNFYWSWSGPVRKFNFLLVLVRFKFCVGLGPVLRPGPNGSVRVQPVWCMDPWAMIPFPGSTLFNEAKKSI